MKKLFTTVLAAIMALSVWAEAPQTISYQAVVRNNVGRLLREHPVGVRISILSGSEDGQVVYSETRTATTNNNGLLTFAIGDANAESSYDLSKIAWADNTYYLRCEMDPDGGNSYTLSSTSQMNSVPYALYAKNIAPEALPTWAQSEEKPVYNYTEIQGAPTVPTKVSELQNDAKYITLQEVPTVNVPTKVSQLENDADYAKKSELPSTAGLLSEASAEATYQPKGNYLTEHQSLADYAKKSELPSVPTKVSQLTNDAGYITESNVTTTLNTINVSELVNDANYATTADVPTKVSQLTNDKGYITAAEVPTVSVPTKVSAFENDKNYLTEHQSLSDYAKKSELPSTAGLLSEDDAAATYQPKGEYLTEHQSLADYAKKSELPSTEGLLSAADAAATYQPKGEYLTEHQSLIDYAKKTDLPTVPTKVSELTNDAYYVTEGNITTVLNTTNVSELVNDANYATTADVPTKVSQLTNDKGYITAADVPTVSVPTKVSAFENDKNYLTEHQSLADYAKKSEVPTKVSELTNDANYVTEGNITTVLNTTNVSELVNDANYATTADVPTKVSQLTNDKGYITAAEVPAVSVPTKVSAFENDAIYLTEHQSLAEYAKKSELPTVPSKVSELTNDAGYITEANVTTTLNTINVSELVNDANYATTADVPTKVSQLTNDKGYITAADVPAVSVPTKVSAFENDKNYLTEHQSLADYAKKTDLPTVPTKVSELTNDANYVTEGNITTVLNTTNVSELVNDANYATTADVPTKVSQLTNDKGYITAADVPAVSVPTKVSAFENDANYLTAHQSLKDYAKKSDLPVVPTKVSAFENDANYLTEHQSLADYAKKSELPSTAGLLSEADAAATYQPKGEYLTEHQSLADYAKKSELPTVPTNVSAFTNDAGYITLSEVPTVMVPTKVSELTNDAEYAKKSELPIVPENVSELTNDANYITLADVPAKVSAFENDAQYITKATFDGIVEEYNALLGKYKKSLDSMKSVMANVATTGYMRTVAIDNGALPGEFSVSADKKVKFSMGNLQYQATTDTWRFASNQYDYVGSPNANIAEDYSGWIDLFGWGTSGWESGANAYLPYSKSTSFGDYYPGGSSTTNLTGEYANADWGVYNAISNGGNQKGQWRTLTNAEWTYLYSGRANAASLRTKATVEGVQGYVFFPDNWVQPDGISVSLDASAFTTNNYSALRWNVLEAQGAVFLPCAGYRNGATIRSVGSSGNYWSSTSISSSSNAYNFYFISSDVHPSGLNTRYYGHSVRLVQEPTAVAVQYTVELSATPAEGGEVTGAGTYEKGASVSISATPATGYIFKSWSDGNTEASRTITLNENISLTATFEAESQSATVGALPGLFSVSADKQVKFSMGNLQYQASTDTWRFAEHQYDYVGTANENIASTYSGWIDLFGWGTSGYHNESDTYNTNYMPYSTSSASIVNIDYNYYGFGPSLNQTDKNLVGTSAEYDWGVHNAISNGGNEKGQWRTLTKNEWVYLYSGRANATSLRTKATVDGVQGYVFFPDNWEKPDGISVSIDASAFSFNNYSASRWNVLEAQGAVFLPCAGGRSGASVNNVGTLGNYWSSTYNSSVSAYLFYFSSSNVYPSYNFGRSVGHSVRLVQE